MYLICIYGYLSNELSCSQTEPRLLRQAYMESVILSVPDDSINDFIDTQIRTIYSIDSVD